MPCLVGFAESSLPGLQMDTCLWMTNCLWRAALWLCPHRAEKERPSSPVSLLTRVLIISWESPHLHDLILIWLAPKGPICKYHHTRSYVLQHRDLVSDTIQSRATRNSADLACFSISKTLAIRMGLCAE